MAAPTNFGSAFSDAITSSLAVTLNGGAPTTGRQLVVAYSGADVVTFPAGWTKVLDNYIASGNGISLTIATATAGGANVMDSGFPARLTVTFPAVQPCAIEIVEMPAGVTYQSITTPSFNVMSLPSVTPPAGLPALLIAFTHWHQAEGLTGSPAGYTLLDQVVGNTGANSQRLITWYQDIAVATGSYNGAFTAAAGVGERSVQLLVAQSPLTAAFSGTPLSGSRPLYVQFTDATTMSPTSWEWDFGDGTTSTDQNPGHVYAAAGSYTVRLIARNATEFDGETKVAYVVASTPAVSAVTTIPTAGLWIDWDNDGFSTGGSPTYELARALPESSVANDDVTQYTKNVVWQRGGQQDVIGGQSVGTLTAILHNGDGRFTPDNTASPLYGKLEVGRRVWLGATRSTGTIKGLWAGYVKEIVPIPRTKEVQVICHDAFGVWQDSRVRVGFSEDRTASTFRQAILTALGLPSDQWLLAPEAYSLAVSGADQKNATSLLDQLNQAVGLRHYILPADDKADHFFYKTIGRNQNLGFDAPAVTLTENDITNMTGYRRTYQTVVNYQQVTPHQVRFGDKSVVWTYDDVPFSVPATGVRKFKATFSSWVRDLTVVITSSGSAAASVVNYGQSAEVTVIGGGAIYSLVISGYPGSEPGSSIEFVEDLASQSRYQIVREGPTIDAKYLRSQPQSRAVAEVAVLRGAAPRTRPTVVFRNRFDKTLSYDHGDVVAQSLTEFALVARRYEIVGVSGAISEGAKVWDFTWVYLETPYQTTLSLFTLNVSTLNGTHILGF